MWTSADQFAWIGVGSMSEHVEAAVLREYRKMGAICPLRRAGATSGGARS